MSKDEALWRSVWKVTTRTPNAHRYKAGETDLETRGSQGVFQEPGLWRQTCGLNS